VKYVIVGFPKCGQVSLVEYLIRQGHQAKKFDKIWHDDALRMILERYQNNEQFVVITRDPIDRMWSGWRFWHYHEHMSFEKYTHVFGTQSSVGQENPIAQSNYAYWLDIIKPLDPLLTTFEEVVKLPNFPHENKTKFQFAMPAKIRQELENDIVLLKFKKDFENYLNKNNFKRLHFENN